MMHFKTLHTPVFSCPVLQKPGLMWQLLCLSIHGDAGLVHLHVQTNNTFEMQLSPQDVVSCSQLLQDCEGGFPFLWLESMTR